MSASSASEQIWQIIAAVPYGKVATYGQVAALAGLPRHARYVGRVLSQLPEGSELPWHRIVNARGCLSFAPGSRAYAQQRHRLEAEGVNFSRDGIKLRQYQWVP